MKYPSFLKLFHKSKKKIKKRSRSAQLLSDRKALLSSKSNFFVREAYKAMRTNVNFSLADENEAHVLLVTSSLQSEGKSTTSINLARSYAENSDNKVLLLDCDLRKPKLARLLELSAPAGLSNILVKSQLQDQAIIPSGIENLDVLLSGDIPPNPSELLSSVRMKTLISEMREKYNYIIIDTPPINMVTDAMVLAPETDGVLMVVRAGVSERGPVSHAVSQLEYAQAKILGFVLNGVDMENRRRYPYGRYRYQQGRNSFGKIYGYGGHSGYNRYGYKSGYGKSGYGYGYGGGYGYGYGYGYGQGQPEPYVEEEPAPEVQPTAKKKR